MPNLFAIKNSDICSLPKLKFKNPKSFIESGFLRLGRWCIVDIFGTCAMLYMASTIIRQLFTSLYVFWGKPKNIKYYAIKKAYKKTAESIKMHKKLKIVKIHLEYFDIHFIIVPSICF